MAHVPQEQRALAEQGTSSSILLIRLRNTQRHAVLWAFHSRLGYTSESSSCASFMKPAPLHPPAVTRQPCPSARSYGGFRTATWPYSAASAAFPYSISLIDKSQDFQRTLLNGGKEGFEPTLTRLPVQTLSLVLASQNSAKNIFTNPFGRIAKMLYICSDIKTDCKVNDFFSLTQNF